MRNIIVAIIAIFLKIAEVIAIIFAFAETIIIPAITEFFSYNYNCFFRAYA